MKELLLVGAGGAIGAMLRYGMSLLPMKITFPFTTLCINILGALCIGFIIGLFDNNDANKGILAFWKVGLCGGFTTFSTFSLETLTLFEKQHYVLGFAYVILSVTLCIAGVFIGKCIAQSMK